LTANLLVRPSFTGAACMMRRLAALLLAFAVLAPLAPQAFAYQRSTLSTAVEGETITVYLYKPEGPGPFPLLVMSHGSPRNAADRANFGVNTLKTQAAAFAAEGVAVAVPIRRGYGSGGRWAETYGDCAQPDYYAAGLTGAEDIQAAIAAASAQPGIDRSRVALIGVSAGGWASVAAGTRSRVLGVVSFAGGRGSRGPDDVCREEALVAAADQYGRSSRVPELWIYSVNDHFFGPALARCMHAAFIGAGGRATFVAAPAYGDDGHKYFADIASWKSEVNDFLRGTGFMR